MIEINQLDGTLAVPDILFNHSTGLQLKIKSGLVKLF